MNLYICLDDRNGLRFNKRRQSRDTAVLEDIRSRLTGDLLIEPFSEKLIREAEIPYVLPPDPPPSQAAAHKGSPLPGSASRKKAR